MRPLDARYSVDDNLKRASAIRSATASCIEPRKRPPGLSVLILNKDKPEFIIPLTEQIQKAAAELRTSSLDITLECLIGDTGSSDSRVLQHYQRLPKETFRVMENLKYNFSANNNQLATLSRFQTLCFCNNDILFENAFEFFRDSFDCYAKLPEGSILGQQLLFADQSIQHAGVYFSPHPSSWALPYHPGTKEKARFGEDPVEVPAVTGALFFIDALGFAKVGQFDEGYESECQDADLCLKAARIGGRSFLYRKHKVTHFENGTRKMGEENNNDRSKFLRLWQSFLELEQL